MPAGQVIGRVSVKVLPDTDDFRRQAQRDLDRIEKTLQVTVQAKIDLTSGLRDALVELRRINQENRVTDSRKMRIYTTIATTGMDAEITKAVRKLQEKADGRKIRINADLVGAVVATDLDEDSLKRVEHQLKDWANDIGPLKVQVEPDMTAGAGTAIRARLAVLTRPRTVPILPVVNDSALAKAATTLAALSGARVVTSYLTDLWRIIRDLDKSAPIITALALAVAGLGASGIAAASNLAALSASLASIAPLVLALPGLLGGAALGIGATVVAFKDFNTVLPEVKTRLSALADLMSANFWSQAEKPIRNLVDGLLPEFASGLAKVSTELGGFFAGLATAFTGVFDGALAGMFADLSTSITIATGATAALANIIRTLGETGAGYLPDLARWFVTIATDFNTWLSAAAADGRLTGWIDTAVIALRDLGTVLASLGSIFAGVATAATAAGGSVLGTLAVALAHVAEVVNSPAFQTGLTGVFAAAHQAMDLIATQSGPALENLFTQLATTLQTLLPVAGQAIGQLLAGIADALAQPAFQQGLLDLFAGIRDAVTGLAPALGPLGAAFGALGSLIGTFVATLGPTLATVFTALANTVTVLAPALQPLIQSLGSGLNTVLALLAPILAQVTTALTALISGGLLPALSTAFSGLTPVVSALGELLGTVLVTALNAITPLLPVIAQLVAAIAPVIAQMLTSLAPIVGQLLTAVAPVLGVILQALTPLITVLLQLLTSVITPLLQVLGDAIAAALPGLGDAFAEVASACMPLVEIVQEIVDLLLPYLVPAIKFMATTLLENLVVAIKAVADVFAAAVKIIKGVWEIFAGLFTGDWGRVWNGIKNVFGGIWDAITAILSAALAIVTNSLKNGLAFSTSIWSSAWNSIKATFSAVWNAITSAATNAWNSIKSTFVTGVATVLTTVRDLPGKAKAALGNLRGALISAGKQLIEGFIDGITAMFAKVHNTLGDLTAKLTDWKGPKATDRVLLTDAGRLVMDGFITGLESRYTAVRKSLAGLTAEIGSLTVRPPTLAGFDSSALAANVTAALSASSGAGAGQKILNYYAAPGSSIDSEEDLFAAAGRARMGW